MGARIRDQIPWTLGILYDSHFFDMTVEVGARWNSMCFLGSVHALLERLQLCELSSAHPEIVLIGTPAGFKEL